MEYILTHNICVTFHGTRVNLIAISSERISELTEKSTINSVIPPRFLLVELKTTTKIIYKKIYQTILSIDVQVRSRVLFYVK